MPDSFTCTVLAYSSAFPSEKCWATEIRECLWHATMSVSRQQADDQTTRRTRLYTPTAFATEKASPATPSARETYPTRRWR
jgi:hypothetical protein